MSIAQKQTICLTSMVSGNMSTIFNENLLPEHQATLCYIQEITDKVVITLLDNDWKVYRWCKSRVEEWNPHVENKSSQWVAIVLTQMSLNAMDNLLITIRDPVKRALIQPIHEALLSLSDQLDPKGEYFDAYDYAEATLTRFYALIGFSPRLVTLADLKQAA